MDLLLSGIQASQAARIQRLLDSESDIIEVPHGGGGGAGYPTALDPFNYSISGTNVTVGAGFLAHHEPEATDADDYYEIAGATIAIASSNYSIIFANYTWKTSAALSSSVSNAATEILALRGVNSTATILRVPVLCVYRTGTTVTAYRHYNVGRIIEITPGYAG